MLRLAVLFILFADLRTRTAYVSDQARFASRLSKRLEKLDQLTVAPLVKETLKELSPQERLYEKLDKLKSLTPEKFDLNEAALNEDDEELLATLQFWGKLTSEQLETLAKGLQRLKVKKLQEKSAVMESNLDYGNDPESEWNEDDEYTEMMMDWDPIVTESTSSSSALPSAVTPSAFTRLQDPFRRNTPRFLSPAEHLAYTNQKPIILQDEKHYDDILRLIIEKVHNMDMDDCSTPQPRWYTVRYLTPAANTVFIPASVQLHRCTPDSGCCSKENEICAPVDGQFVTLPFLLNQAPVVTRLVPSWITFYNHTRCKCVSIESLDEPIPQDKVMLISDRQSDWRPPTEEPSVEEELTAAPQLQRCTCPTLFIAKVSDTGCHCVCDWVEMQKRQDCLMLAKGKEHFGMRDRYCIENGSCHLPKCAYGAYNSTLAKCPIKNYRRLKFHGRGK